MKKVLSLLLAMLMLIAAVPALAEDNPLENLTFADIKGDNTDQWYVESDLNLVTTYNGVSVTWQTSDPSTVAADGTVTRKTFDTAVMLTANSGSNEATVNVIVAAKDSTELFYEGFEEEWTDGSAIAQTNDAAAETSYNSWYLTENDYATASSQGVTATLNENDGNTALKFKRASKNTSAAHLQVAKAFTNPCEGITVYSANIKIINQGTGTVELKAFNGLGNPIRQNKLVYNGDHSYNSAASSAYSEGLGKWNQISFVINHTDNTVKFYWNGILAHDDNIVLNSSTTLNLAAFRMNRAVYGEYDIDNIRVRQINLPYEEELAKAIYGEEDNRYINANLPASVKIDGADYAITYTDSTGKISSTGAVTLTDSYVPVSGLKAEITVNGTAYSVTRDVILTPKYAQEIFADGFGIEPLAAETTIAGSDTAETVTWKADQTTATMESLKEYWTISNVALSSNNVLKLNKLQKNGTMSNLKAVYTLDSPITEGKVAFSYRIMPGNSTFNLQSDPFGRINATQWITKSSKTLDLNVTMELNNWYVVTFVADYEADSVKLYIDGTLQATFEDAGLTSISDVKFSQQRNQNPATQTVYIDDVAVHALRSDDIFLDSADITVGGVVNSITLGGDSSKLAGASVIIGAFGGEELLAVDKIEGALSIDTALSSGMQMPAATDTLKCFIWNTETLAPLAKVSEIVIQSEAPSVFIAGDSIACDYSAVESPRTGWGGVIGSYLDDSITIINKAKSGADTKSFVSDGLFSQILSQGKRGDYVLIALCINDEAHSTGLTNYENNLKEYVETIGEYGMHPIMITPTIRHTSIEGNAAKNTAVHEYAEKMRFVANEYGITYVDLEESFTAEYNRVGEEISKTWYMIDYTGDGTHFCDKGADVIAQLIAQGLKDANVYFADKINVN